MKTNSTVTDIEMPGSSTLEVRFSQAAWYAIREYAGIYGVKIVYSNIKRYLTRKQISTAYFNISKQPLFTTVVTLNAIGNQIKLKSFTSEQWISVILKHVASGYKNRAFYEEISRHLAKPPKVKCLCGRIITSMCYYTHTTSAVHKNNIHETTLTQKKIDEFYLKLTNLPWQYRVYPYNKTMTVEKYISYL